MCRSIGKSRRFQYLIPQRAVSIGTRHAQLISGVHQRAWHGQNAFHETGLRVKPWLLQGHAPAVIRCDLSPSPLTIGQTSLPASGAGGNARRLTSQTASSGPCMRFLCPTRDGGRDVREGCPVGDGLLGACTSNDRQFFLCRRGPRVLYKARSLLLVRALFDQRRFVACSLSLLCPLLSFTKVLIIFHHSFDTRVILLNTVVLSLLLGSTPFHLL
ncbi:hypothetical protein CC86DRAFT_51809 [Ophiobolus disseminans]|uniref:Uncharacterized protein n=1 Tax=Ophiobolus disseminans TaxID=1469910 RepID=A0A6A6ZSZ9_9PLEO|nr:hypothetical protein CC86DRAFT_51809 [Ophiobolus disseminans]